MDLVLFVLSFFIILIGCEFFTNGVEWAGKRFRLTESAVGSLLAAVGTAMPETILPLVAILLLGGSAGRDIGMGSILGSPFTLSTLALFLCGVAAVTIASDRKTRVIHVDNRMVRRMLGFFMLAYSLAALAAFLPVQYSVLKPAIAMILGAIYVFYVYSTLKAKGISTEEEALKPLYFQAMAKRIFGLKEGIDKPSTWLIASQVLVALIAIVAGADIFVTQVDDIAMAIRVSPLILSLLISPMATELPEIFNSIIWMKQDKDVFALGNILGSMVYQSCILAIIGIALTPWHLELSDHAQFLQTTSIGLSLASSALLYLSLRGEVVRVSGLLASGLLYLVFIALVLQNL
jgi:cation:H+ antiporter